MKIFELKNNIERYSANKTQVAIRFNNVEVTYSKLNNSINYLISEFKKLEIMPGSPIVIYMSNCIELLVAYLALIIYGCIVVPVDSETPIVILNEIIESSNAKYTLYCDEFIDINKLCCLSYGVRYDKLSDECGNYEQHKCDVGDDVIYIYTSGSTGFPKGVKLTYRGISNHMDTKISLLELNGQEKFCLSFSPSFVASIWQILVPIYLGSSLTIYSRMILNNIFLLFDNIDKDEINIVSLIPHQLYAYCLSPAKKGKLLLSNLRKIILTGEKLEAKTVKVFSETYPNIQLINAYGQSECCDDTFHYFIPKDFNQKNVPIGDPIQNIDYMIVDKNENVLSKEGKGELLISGDCLTSGYINNKDQNKERFSVLNGIRYFKTGDLVEKKNNLIYFLGRIDNQIKIRGFRIEPEEVENVIELYPEIEKCVVAPCEIDTRKESVLICGYISKEEIDIYSIRQHMERHLQQYKIPTQYFKVEKIPLLPNGKVDRKAMVKLLNEINSMFLRSGFVDEGSLENIKKEIFTFLGVANDMSGISLDDCGLDSLSFVELVVHLEQKYNFEFEDEFLLYSSFSDIEHLARYVHMRIR